MDLLEQLRVASKTIFDISNVLKTKETTQNALALPFIDMILLSA